MLEIKVAFWNVENLFDTITSQIAADLEFTPARGWTEAVLNRKLKNIASIIKQMHGGQGPDLLGLCEVENQSVVERLIAEIGNPKYKVAHVESPDIRGIDCSLIYSTDIFKKPKKADIVGHLIHLRFQTRDIFQVRLTVKANNADLHVFVNHWPSRRQGQFESEPHRMTVAARCGQIVDRILKLDRAAYTNLPDTATGFAQIDARWNRNILLMGDFNDEPFNRSETDYLRASKDMDKVEETLKSAAGKHLPSLQTYLKQSPALFNLSWPLLAIPDNGTFFFSGSSSNTMNLLDQFMVSRGLCFGNSALKIRPDSVRIFRAPDMTAGSKQRPKGFVFQDKKPFDETKAAGYSDHFPIELTLETL
jgi:hypothetical protein